MSEDNKQVELRYPVCPPAEDPLPSTSLEYRQIATRFIHSYRELAEQVYAITLDKGFWDEGKKRNKAEMIALMHSELSEALEALRKNPNGADKYCPEYSNLEVEFADTIIRIMDFGHGFGLDIAGAVNAKIKFNATRPTRHGKQF